MEIIDFIKDYWVQLTFLFGLLTALVTFILSMIEAVKCSLRNDILAIYDRCDNGKKITRYQLQSVEYSFTIYKKLGGNSFVAEIVERMRDFELID